jgi:hypothetical protein
MHSIRLAILVPILPLACVAQEAVPRLDRVGVIEGFYGEPWSHQDRLDMLRFMGDVGLNMYVYAPKDDPYHRERWREPYPAAEFARLEELADSSAAHAVEFWYAISPGESIAFSSDADYATLMEKIEAVLGLGVSRFGLFLDDVPTTLAHASDQQAFGSLAEAHASLINRLATDLTARSARLSVTPTTYTNAWGDTTYLRELGEQVDPAVPLYWTGPDVASPTITAVQAESWGELIGRKPWVWDNYPVNDYARWRPFLGPFPNRAPELAGQVGALVANPMNEAHASMIPLATLAIYARNPGAYDPGAALREALVRLYGESTAALFTPLISVFGGYGWESNALEPLFILRDTIDAAGIERAIAGLDTALAALERAGSTGFQPVQPVVEELRPFLDGARRRLIDLKTRGLYARSDGRLTYSTARDRYAAERGTAETDGRLTEWSSASWHELHGPSPAPRAAFRRAGDTLFIVIDVRDGSPRSAAGARAGTADHAQIIVDVDPSDAPHGLTASDLVIVVPRPVQGAELDAYVGGLQLEGFMSKWLADNERMTMSEFLLSSFSREPAGAGAALARQTRVAARGTGEGYVVELAIPGVGDITRLSLTVADRGTGTRIWSLAGRNYPGNPGTFVIVAGR